MKLFNKTYIQLFYYKATFSKKIAKLFSFLDFCFLYPDIFLFTYFLSWNLEYSDYL